MGAPVNILNMCSYEDFLPWKNNFMLKSGANIFVSQILVQRRYVTKGIRTSCAPKK